MKISRDKRGFFNLFWALFTLFLSFIIMITATSIFSSFSSMPGTLLSPIEGYYKADLGVYRAKWLLDNDKIIVGPFPAAPSTIDIDINGDAKPDITVVVTNNATNDFSIVSTSTREGKSISAHYFNGTIDSLN